MKNDDLQRYLNALVSKEDPEHRVLTPEMVVEDAKQEESPLHSMFEWNDKSAAHKHRLHTARQLIKSVTIKITVHNVQVAAPYYVRDPEAQDNEQGYRSVADIKNEPPTAKTVLLSEISRVKQTLDRASKIANALGLDDEFEELKASVLSVETKVKAA